VPSVMVVTDTFAEFARRMAATQGCPYILIAETPNPLRQLEPAVVRARAENMMPAIIEGLTLPHREIERRLAARFKQIAGGQHSVKRSAPERGGMAS
jgi:hypothetical protein